MSKYTDAFLELRKVENEFKQKIGLIRIIAQYFKDHGKKPPIIVGGEAVEIYTRGGFTTQDIDIKGSKQTLIDCLEKELGFERLHHVFSSSNPNFSVEWQGSTLEEGREGEAKIRIIAVGEDEIAVVGFEDLIIDRLNAAKFSGHQESFEQAKELYIIIQIGKLSFDESYAQTRANHDDVMDTYTRMKNESNIQLRKYST